jgi:hypothetical protein
MRTLAVVAITPKALNVSYNSRSSTLSSRLPIKRLAPTSSCFLSEDAYGNELLLSVNIMENGNVIAMPLDNQMLGGQR